MDDLLSEFLTETTENLSVLDVELVRLEQNPNDPELLGNIFRLVHTIKGTCGFLGLPRLESVAHAGENVLGKIRDGELEVTPEAVSLILEALDSIKMLLSTLEQTEAEPEGDDRELIDRLNALADSAGAAPPAAKPAPEPAAEPAAEEPVAEPAARSAPAVAEAATEMAAAPEPTAPAGEASDPSPAAAPAPKPKDAAPAAAAKGDGAAKDSAVAAHSIRVNVDLLENLMTMVSELVLTRNQLLQILRMQKESDFGGPLQRLNHITSELQEGVMKTRMQPIGNAWAKLPRLVRDLALELDKKIDLEMLGADTELDRQVLELIKDPLTHMVRNSADHGIEIPKIRKEAGKPEAGKITLNAYHEGGHIIIEIKDNGAGLSSERIKAKVVANALATQAELDAMSDQQIQQFIFKPGFSTAAKVTSVSGRGVGMDVVRTNIEKIGGTVELKSVEGKGTTFIIKIPLTLAIVSALIVECSGERFAIPQISVLELVRASAHSENAIETINDTPVLRLRNRLLPLVSLHDLLKLGPSRKLDSQSEHFIVVTQVGAYTFGIMVDRVFDTEEIVVKPVAPILRDISIFSGNTILGDGSVIMILDPNGIAAATGEASLGDHAAETAAVASTGAAGERRAGRAQGGAALAHRPARGDQARDGRIFARPADGAVSRASHAAGDDFRRLSAQGGRAPAGPRVLRPRAVHGPGGGRDRRHRRGDPLGRAELGQAGDAGKQHRGRQGDRHRRRGPLPDPGVRRLVRRHDAARSRQGARQARAPGGRQPVLPQPADAASRGRGL